MGKSQVWPSLVSMSVVTNQVDVKLINGLPLRMPERVVRAAATVPAGTMPASVGTSCRAAPTAPLVSKSSNGSPMAVAISWSDGPNELRAMSRCAWSAGPGALPKPIRPNSISAEMRAEQSAYSLICR